MVEPAQEDNGAQQDRGPETGAKETKTKEPSFKDRVKRIRNTVGQAVDSIDQDMGKASVFLGRLITRARRRIAVQVTRGARKTKKDFGEFKDVASEVTAKVTKDVSNITHEVKDRVTRGARRVKEVEIAIAKKYLHLIGLIARDPEKDKPGIIADKVRNLVKDLGPFIGPKLMYADARAKYHHAVKTNDEEKKHEARRECLMACVDFATDGLTVGIARIFGKSGRRIIKLSRTGKFVKQISTLKILRKLPSVNLQMTEVRADKLLEDKIVAGVMDACLLWDPSEEKVENK